MSVRAHTFISPSSTALICFFSPSSHRIVIRRKKRVSYHHHQDVTYTQILQKCDAKRPCATCTNSGGESGCFYDELRIPHVIQPLPYTAPPFPFSDEGVPGPSSGRSFSYQLLGSPEEVADSSGKAGLQIGSPPRPDPDAPHFSSADPVEWDLDKLHSTSHPCSGSFDPGGTKHDVRSGPRRPANPPSPPSALFVLPSLRLSIIPRPLHTPLSFFPPENFQVTGETSGTLEMSLYVSFVASLVHS